MGVGRGGFRGAAAAQVRLCECRGAQAQCPVLRDPGQRQCRGQWVAVVDGRHRAPAGAGPGGGRGPRTAQHRVDRPPPRQPQFVEPAFPGGGAPVSGGGAGGLPQPLRAPGPRGDGAVPAAGPGRGRDHPLRRLVLAGRRLAGQRPLRTPGSCAPLA